MSSDFRSWFQWKIESQEGQTSYSRPLGDSEYEYYVPAKESGIGDIFLHISFSLSLADAPRILDPERVAKCWAILRKWNPLLMTRVVQREGEPWFWFTPPQDSIKEAKESIIFVDGLSRDELISSYLNGPRTLSDEKMSYLVISRPTSSSTETQQREEAYSLLFCAPHYIGDSSSLHQCTHKLFVLLTSSDLPVDALTKHENDHWMNRLPPPLESRLPVPGSAEKLEENKPRDKLTLAKAAAKIVCLKRMWGEVGAHTLQRYPLGSVRSPQKTVLVERSFSVEQTKKILAKCKQHSVSINHVLFALCGIAWRQTHPQKEDVPMPIMMYTAFNLRPYLTSVPRAPPFNEETSFFLALTYFRVVLPSFPIPGTSDVNTGPSTKGTVLWSRAKEVKKQVQKFAGNSCGKAEVEEIHKMWLGYWALMCARERAERVRGMVKAQSSRSRTEILGTRSMKAKTRPITFNDIHTIWRMRHTPASTSAAQTEGTTTPDTPGKLPPAPSATLFDLSLIGNLDTIYRQTQYCASTPLSYEGKHQQLITIHNVTTASRLKPSGLLILSHTFNKKLWVYLCWDVEGFPHNPDSEVDIFWAALGDLMDTIACMDLSKL